MAGSVLIAMRDAAIRDLVCEALHQDGFRVTLARNRVEALALSGEEDVVIADIELDLFAAVKARSPRTEVVLVACERTLQEALATVRCGAFDVVLRPFYVEDISLTAACAAARRQRAGIGSVLSHVRRNYELVR